MPMPRFEVHNLESQSSWDVDVDRDRFFVGRSPKAEICLRHSSISRQHLLIERAGDEYRFVDLCSTNGTLVNDAHHKQGVLRHGDVVRVGAFRIVMRLNGEFRPTADSVTKNTRGVESNASPASPATDADVIRVESVTVSPGSRESGGTTEPAPMAAVDTRRAVPSKHAATPKATALFVVVLALMIALCIWLGVVLGSLATSFDVDGKGPADESSRLEG